MGGALRLKRETFGEVAQMRTLVTIAFTLCTFAAQAQDMANKTISIIVGYAAGGGTDAMARTVASLYPRYLPGAPNIVVRNIPGADGVIAANYFAQQVKPDGLTLIMGSSTTADPQYYRKAQANFDPSRFEFVGGVGMGGSAMLIDREAQKRLMDRGSKPVVIGVTGGVPRSGMQAAAWGIEYLGWNAKWVLGYRGTNELLYALERGEVSMTSTGNMYHLQRLLAGGSFKLLTQTGSFSNGVFVGRSDFKDAQLMTDLVRDRIKDKIALDAFTYWSTLTAVDKWLALPPQTPTDIRNVYRAGFEALVKDVEFGERSRNVSDAFEPMSADDIEKLVTTLHRTSPEAIDYIASMLRHQGLRVE
jgi:hypothetical protein